MPAARTCSTIRRSVTGRQSKIEQQPAALVSPMVYEMDSSSQPRNSKPDDEMLQNRDTAKQPAQ